MTPFLEVQHLTKSIGDLILFENISFSISEGQHIGIIARNGTGKSTLLNILCGRDDYDSGEVVFRNGIRVGYLEQTPIYDLEMSVLDACLSKTGDLADLISRYERCLIEQGNPGLDLIIDEMDRRQAWDFEHKAKQILGKLDIHDLKQPIQQLSGGQLKRVALANVLLSEPDLLILDEPTNHLDLNMIEWLENYLGKSSKALLMVTHDRYFLDRVCSVILELDDKSIYSYKGNYEYFLEKRNDRISVMNANITRANNLYRKELDWMRRMPSARGTKAKYRKDAFYELEQLAKAKKEEHVAKIAVKSGYIGSKIFEAEYVSKAFMNQGDRKIILDNFYYNFTRYEKMGIVGANGTGKSTFIKLLLGLEKPDSGRFTIGETVKFGYYSQEGMAFDQQMKVIDAVRRIAETIDLGNGKKMTAMQFLNHFQFPPSRQQDYIYKLSGGEKRRLYLCTILIKNPNFLILDEPTNDLDIATLQILEEYLCEFSGCVIIISHDRYFMDKVVDHLLVFKGDGVIDDFPGNYTQYRDYLELKDIEESKKKSESNPSACDGVSEKNTWGGVKKRKLSFKEKNELETLESEISSLEAEKKEIENALCSGTLSVDELVEKSKRLPFLEEELELKSLRWFELSEI